MVANQTSMIGPNILPTAPLPSLCRRKRTTMIVTVIGITRLSIDDEMVLVPSTAERTEIAGVIMLSPKKRAAPNTPRPASMNLVLPLTLSPSCRTCEISAIIPPSPSLSALMTSPTYLTVTMIVTAQKISDAIP